MSETVETSKTLPALRKAIEIISEKDVLKNFLSKKSQSKKLEWYVYAYSYLQAAGILFDSCLSINLRSQRSVLIPACYNLKHGLELVLKATFRFLGIDDLEPGIDSHDIQSVFKSLKKKLIQENKNAVKNLAKELKLTEPKAEEFLQQNIDEISDMVVKYYHNVPFMSSETVGVFVEDPFNEIFRYPEAKRVKLMLNSHKILLSLEDSDIDKLKKDAKRANRCLSVLFLAFTNDNTE